MSTAQNQAQPEKQDQLEESKETVSLREFLSQLGISYSTYRILRKAGKTPPEVRLGKKIILLRKKAITEWLQSREETISVQSNLSFAGSTK
jgi:predicted DNA-binding transcriptional regulator AlpA